jgi:hypothetical protein
MTKAGPWTTADFDAMSWHDVHVHGFRLDRFDENNGSADLVLDIDYILKWEKSGDSFLFTVCRADLRFNDVFGLKLDLDYASPTAGMCDVPARAHRTARRELTRNVALSHLP